jgi:hypothetical protein
LYGYKKEVVVGSESFARVCKKIGISQCIFMKVPNTKFHRNPPSGRRADMCGKAKGLTKSLIIFGSKKTFYGGIIAPATMPCTEVFV